METIKEIKEAFLHAVTEEQKKEFLFHYEKESRGGVRTLLEKCRKQLDEMNQEKQRLERMKRYEREYASYSFICGIDEVGRGPLAGPVVACGVILPKDCSILYINDSKQVSEKKREELYDIIMEQAVAVGVGMVGPKRIDEINILQATYEAMRMAVEKLAVKPDLLLNDAVHIPGISVKQVGIVKGDEKSISIAAASIIAKVTRDRMMREYDKRFPGYGFSRNKGYGSKEHRAALLEKGPCSIHRSSFLGKILSME